MRRMRDGEDYNEFNCWDSGGAAFMLALVPAVLYYVFGDHDHTGAAMLVMVAVGCGVFVLLLARYTSSRMVSRILQPVGTVLCILYWVYAIYLLCHWNRFETTAPPPDRQQETVQPQA